MMGEGTNKPMTQEMITAAKRGLKLRRSLQLTIKTILLLFYSHQKIRSTAPKPPTLNVIKGRSIYGNCRSLNESVHMNLHESYCLPLLSYLMSTVSCCCTNSQFTGKEERKNPLGIAVVKQLVFFFESLSRHEPFAALSLCYNHRFRLCLASG